MHGTLPAARDGKADDRACRIAIRAGSKSFHAASMLLPRQTRRSALALYAFCRVSDDLVDDGGLAPKSGAATDQLDARLTRIYAGNPIDHPADRAFAAAVERHGIPRALPQALIEGFEWDEAGRSYETIGALHEYGARVAASVGAMMTLAMGIRDPIALARACDLGLAMQLTNIARDVGEDARNGRLYLPRSWMREVGIDPDRFLDDPRHCERIGEVIARVLEEAQRLYLRSATGIATLPRPCRTAIGAALAIYRDIGREIAKANHDSIAQRAVTSRNRKIALALAAVPWRFANRPVDRSPPMPQVRHLVDAVNEVPAPQPINRSDGGMGRFMILMTDLDGRVGTDLAARVRERSDA